MREYMKTILNGLRMTIPQGCEQPDWDQNDPTAKDYVKNRTHSFEAAPVLFDDDTKFEFYPMGAGESGCYVKLSEPLEAGNAYSVTIDGETAVGVSESQSNMPTWIIVIGLQFSFGTVYMNGSIDDPHATLSTYINGQDYACHMTIKKGQDVVNQLDEMYIPNTVPRLESAKVGQSVVVSAVDENGKPTAWKAQEPLLLNADDADTYLTDSTYGDTALEAIKTSRNILVKVPNADGGNFTAIYSPILMHQVPNYQNKYLYLFFLRDEKQDLSALLGQPAGTVLMPTYGELKMLLSQEYNTNPLEE